MLRSESQGSDGDEDGAHTCQEDIGAISIGSESEFAPQVSEPQSGRSRPGMVDVIDKQRCYQNQYKDAAHTFYGLHPHVFDIQSIFLIKAIGVFDLRAVAPLRVDSSCILGSLDRYSG